MRAFHASGVACRVADFICLTLARLRRFRIDNTDHIIDVNRGNNAFEYDQVNLICPSYPRKEGTATDSESYIIYNVSPASASLCPPTPTLSRAS